MERFTQFAVIAAEEAVAGAGVEWTAALRESAAVVTGSCLGGRPIEEAGYGIFFTTAGAGFIRSPFRLA